MKGTSGERETKRGWSQVKALEAVLALFPDAETIDALKADAGLGYRPCPIIRTPKDSEVVAWRAALTAAGRG